MKTLILGGVRSGKSRQAQMRAEQTKRSVIYVATATADDREMQERIADHRANRPAHWRVVEEPLRLADMLSLHASAQTCVLVDCLTLWLTNLLLCSDPDRLSRERAALIDAVRVVPGHVIFVSNETGMGVVPLGELTRRYCDEAGRLHQDLALLCDNVILTVAGLPIFLKGQ